MNQYTRAGILAACTITLAACGASAPSADTAPAVAVTTIATTTTTSPATTQAPSTEPASTEASTSAAAVAPADVSPAFIAFAEVHRELVSDWSADLSAFGDEALDYIDDVSKAPSAVSALESSTLLSEAIGPGETDPDLMLVRKFATGMSSAIAFAADGDQSAAMSVFVQLQAGSQQLTPILEQLQA